MAVSVRPVGHFVRARSCGELANFSGGMSNAMGGDRGGPPIGAMDYSRARAAQLNACTLPTGAAAGALSAAMGATQRAMNMAAYYGGAGYGGGGGYGAMGGGGVGGAMSGAMGTSVGAYAPPKSAENSSQVDRSVACILIKKFALLATSDNSERAGRHDYRSRW